MKGERRLSRFRTSFDNLCAAWFHIDGIPRDCQALQMPMPPPTCTFLFSGASTPGALLRAAPAAKPDKQRLEPEMQNSFAIIPVVKKISQLALFEAAQSATTHPLHIA
jgi:hypothetical protein